MECNHTLKCWCSNCRKEKDRQYYLANKTKRRQQITDHRKNLLKTVRKYKAENPCTDCGNLFHPAGMQFDHLGEKTANVADLVKQGSALAVWKEIEKCELVCAVCHAIRTEERQLDMGKLG